MYGGYGKELVERIIRVRCPSVKKSGQIQNSLG